MAWIILNFNQKRGYYQLRGEEEVENPNKEVTYYSLMVTEVTAEAPNKKGEIWYSIQLENGWVYRRTSKIPLDDWKGKILLLESSEEQPTPEKYRHMIEALKNTGIFDVIHGILVGKSMDEMYTKEYQDILIDVVNNPKLSIVWNLNVGHATPRTIVPFGVMARVDVEKQKISFKY